MQCDDSGDDRDEDTEEAGMANAIDDNLRRVYEDMLEQDVPARFTELLARLKAQDDGAVPPQDGTDADDPGQGAQ